METYHSYLSLSKEINKLTQKGKAFYPGPWFDIKLYILFPYIKEWIYVDRQPCYEESPLKIIDRLLKKANDSEKQELIDERASCEKTYIPEFYNELTNKMKESHFTLIKNENNLYIYFNELFKITIKYYTQTDLHKKINEALISDIMDCNILVYSGIHAIDMIPIEIKKNFDICILADENIYLDDSKLEKLQSLCENIITYNDRILYIKNVDKSTSYVLNRLLAIKSRNKQNKNHIDHP